MKLVVDVKYFIEIQTNWTITHAPLGTYVA